MANHEALVARLNVQSVNKHHDAYADIAWEDVDPEDPRFERPHDHGLGRTAWYRALPASSRARMGLHLAMTQMRLGIDFESILMRGLLEFAQEQPMGSAELRYALHEVIEESQHTLMFQEMIARARLPVLGLTGFEARSARRVPAMARSFPELFFIHVLAGEGPIDHAQKAELSRRDALHPLLRRVMQIHVMEEARHIAFAVSFLRERVPRLSAWKMLQLRVATPIALSVMARQMLEPPRWLLDMYAVPNEVRREAYRDDPTHRRQIIDGLGTLRRLCGETGIVTTATVPLWRALGIWDAPAPRLLAA